MHCVPGLRGLSRSRANTRVGGRPAAVVCTSGTDAANLHPAVLEAQHDRVPLVVLTADRPPELRGTGASRGDNVLSHFLRHLITA